MSFENTNVKYIARPTWIVESIKTRKCSRCKQILPITDFRQIKTGIQVGQYTYYCKECNKEYLRWKYRNDPKTHDAMRRSAAESWRRTKVDLEHKNHVRQQMNKSWRRYQAKNRLKFNEIHRARRALKKSGLKTLVWERAKGKCESCGAVLIDGSSNCAYHHLNGNRFDNRLGNLVLLCTKCHLHKFHSYSHKTNKSYVL